MYFLLPECPRSPDHMERFACPRPDRRGRFRCIDDRALCDGFYDCPDKEDENPDHCLFYKTVRISIHISNIGRKPDQIYGESQNEWIMFECWFLKPKLLLWDQFFFCRPRRISTFWRRPCYAGPGVANTEQSKNNPDLPFNTELFPQVGHILYIRLKTESRLMSEPRGQTMHRFMAGRIISVVAVLWLREEKWKKDTYDSYLLQIDFKAPNL